MIKFLTDIKIKSKFVLVAIITTLGFIVFASFYQSTLLRVKVNGPIYEKIVLGKDLIADILPPPEYIIESYLVLLELIHEHNPSQINLYIERGNQLKDEYMVRHDFWVKTLEDGEMKKFMVEDSYKFAMDFFNIRDNEFIPAIKNKNYELASNVAFTKLKPAYEGHRKNIDEVVKLATVSNTKFEEDSKTFVSKRQTLLIIIGAAIIIIVIILSLLFSSYFIARPLRSIVNSIKILANGNISNRINLNRKDEIGDIANAMDDFSEKLNISVIGSFNRISKGDLSFEVKQTSPDDQITPIINNLTNSIRDLVNDLKERLTGITTIASSLFDTSNNYSKMTSQVSDSINNISSASDSMHNSFKDISVQTSLANMAMTKVLDVYFCMSTSYTSWEKSLSLISRGAINVKKVISHIEPLTNWKSAFELIEAQKALKIILKPL